MEKILQGMVSGDALVSWLIIAFLAGYFAYKEWPEFQRRIGRRSVMEETGKSLVDRIATIETIPCRIFSIRNLPPHWSVLPAPVLLPVPPHFREHPGCHIPFGGGLEALLWPSPCHPIQWQCLCCLLAHGYATPFGSRAKPGRLSHAPHKREE